MSRLAPRNLELSSALKNSIKLPLANSYFSRVLLNLSSKNLPVHFIIFSKSRNAPLLKCGIDSATMLISKPAVLVALSINIGIIPNVFPAHSPPTT